MRWQTIRSRRGERGKQKKKKKKKRYVEEEGIEPATSCMLSKRSTDELHPRNCTLSVTQTWYSGALTLHPLSRDPLLIQFAYSGGHQRSVQLRLCQAIKSSNVMLKTRRSIGMNDESFYFASRHWLERALWSFLNSNRLLQCMKWRRIRFNRISIVLHCNEATQYQLNRLCTQCRSSDQLTTPFCASTLQAV